MTILAGVLALCALVGTGQAVAGWWLVRRCVERWGTERVGDLALASRQPSSPPPPSSSGLTRGSPETPKPDVPAGPRVKPEDDGAGGQAQPEWPPITILKPLHGDEPLLEQALESTIRQDYPTFQIVFGVQNPADPAIAVVERLRARHPAIDIALVIDPTDHGPNRKVGNLINMLPRARHDVIVIADSDLHVRPDYLRRIAATLAEPGVGLATVLYAGLPASAALHARLGATQITHGFLPGAVMARAMGREDCLGATMAVTRETLARIGGLPALVRHLADDNVLGQRVRALGLRVALAPTVVATTVPEDTLRALFRHELRWARTIRALAPASHAGSVLQYPIVWAVLAGLASPGGCHWGWALVPLAWAARAAAARGIDRALAPMLNGLATPCPIWHLPTRDALSVAVWLVSHAGKHVDWRGQGLHADTPPRPVLPDDAQEPRTQ